MFRIMRTTYQTLVSRLGSPWFSLASQPWAIVRLEELEPRYVLTASIAEVAGFIQGCQLANGAISQNQGPASYVGGRETVIVQPYFSNLAVSGLLAAPQGLGAAETNIVAKNWINWVLSNYNPSDGTIQSLLYFKDDGSFYMTQPPDADDSNAATFLETVDNYYKESNDAAFFTPVLEAQLEMIASVLTSRQTANGLILPFVDPMNTYTIEQTEDNCENFAGLNAMANLEATAFNNSSMAAFYFNSAERCGAAIKTILFDPTLNSGKGLFIQFAGDSSSPDPTKYYPDVQLQVFPALDGVIPTTSDLSHNIISWIDSTQNGTDGNLLWTTRTNSEPLPYVALLAGFTQDANNATMSVASSPFPTQTLVPAYPASAPLTVADAGFVLRSLVPAPNDDSVSTPYNTHVTINVLANDYDITAPTASLTVSISSNPSSGTVSLQTSQSILYTPKTGFYGVDSFTYDLTDSAGNSTAATVTVTVAPPSITINPATLPDAVDGVTYTQMLSPSGGAAPYSNFQITAGALPAGLSLSSAGTISGTPKATGNYTFTIATTDSSTGDGPFTQSQSFALTVDAPTIVINPSSMPGGQAGTSYSQLLSASGGIAPYTNFVISTGSLPTGLSLGSDTHTVSGIPTTAGTFTFTVSATDSSTGTGPFQGSTSYTITIVPGPPSLSNSVVMLGSSTVQAGNSTFVTLTAIDAFGNQETTGGLPISFGLGNGSAQGNFSSATDNRNGTYTATFQGTISGNNTIVGLIDNQALIAGLPTVTVIPESASRLIVAMQPSSPVIAGSGFGIIVSALDSFGNLTSSFSGAETISIATNAGGGILSGTVTMNAVNGIASFSGLSINRTGIGYTLQVGSAGLAGVISTSFTVSAGTATQLLVTTQPTSSVTAGFGFSLAVTAEDSLGNVATSFTGNVAVALSTNPSGGSLGGSLTVAAINGIAAFSGLTIDQAGLVYAIQAMSGGLTSGTTNPFAIVAGSAVQLVVTSQPLTDVTAGTGFGITVAAEDLFGNRDTAYAGNVSASILVNPGGSTLGGATTVSALNGIASFTNLSLDIAATGYALQMSSIGLSRSSTQSFTVIAGQASHLIVQAQPPMVVTAGNAFGLDIAAEDSFGNLATAYTGSVALTLATNPGNTTLGGSVAMVVVNGIAAFSSLTLDIAASGYAIQASSGSLTTAATNAFDVGAGSASQLVIATQPTGTLAAGLGFGLVVAAEDNFGNLANFNGSVAVALKSNPGGGTLGGVLSVVANDGIATFTGLALNIADDGYTLQATSGLLSSTTTNAITIVAAAPSQLLVTTQPSSGLTAGSALGLIVAALDSFGNVATAFNGVETVSIGANVGGGTLSGVLSANAIDGIASFSGLGINRSGIGYTFQVASTGLSGASSDPFTVIAGAAAQLVVTTQPPGAVGAGNGFGLMVTAEDSLGNRANTFSGNVIVALASNPGGSTLGGTPTTSAANGVAIFSNLTLNHAGNQYTLQASSGNLTLAVTNTINVSPGLATQLVVTSKPPTSLQAGAAFGLVVTAEDSFGNVATSFSNTETVALVANPGPALSAARQPWPRLTASQPFRDSR